MSGVDWCPEKLPSLLFQRLLKTPMHMPSHFDSLRVNLKFTVLQA